MCRSAVCAVILLLIALADLSSAGLLLANQTLKLELTCRAAKKTTITCNNATTNELEEKLLTHLNADLNSRVPTTNCEYLLGGSTQCENQSVTFDIMLTCPGSRADGNLVDHVKQQQMVIKQIMDRKTSEEFTSGNSKAICRLFRESDQRKTPLPTCIEECTKEYQGPVALCDCPFVEVLEPSCNIPAVLVHITKVTSISGVTCDQVGASMHSISQQMALAGPISYEELHFQLATDHINTSFICNSSGVNGLHLNMLTSVTVRVNTPHCSDNISCIQQFNIKQLTTIKQYFQLMLPFVPQIQSLSVKGAQINDSLPSVDVELSCDNGTTLTNDGACCFPGCNTCNDGAPINVVLEVNFNVSQLSTVTCSPLNFTELINSVTTQITIGGVLVKQAGGRLVMCGEPSVNCSEAEGRVAGMTVRIPLLLTLAPGVIVNSEAELIDLISRTISGLIEGGQVSVGGRNIKSEGFGVELTNECTFTPEPPTAEQCPVGSYLKDESCHLCPIGHYTDRSGQSRCVQCPDGQTTNSKGATSINQCVGIPKPCPKGQHSVTGLTPCRPCPKGMHQGRTGQTSCTSCPPGFTTPQAGSTSFFDCKVPSVTSPPPTTPPTTPPPTIRTYPAVTVTDTFFTSPNYPKNYPALEKRTYTFQCSNSTLSAGLFVLDFCLGSGDSLMIHDDICNGSKVLTIPEPIMLDNFGSVTVTFQSDGHGSCRGFRIAVGCYLTAFKDFIKRIAFDCNVRNYLKNAGDDVIIKILKLLNGQASIQTLGTDPDFAPLYQASVSPSPCKQSNKCYV